MPVDQCVLQLGMWTATDRGGWDMDVTQCRC